MEPFARSPYRRVIPLDKDESPAVITSTLIWLSTIYFYKKRVFAHDRNMMRLAMFGLASYFATNGYIYFFFKDAKYDAIKMNNEREFEHQAALKRL
mmetsp:Transcript_33252/g.24430  ORF Transcript_33252/g.24430 Transcript_33252/m.24430 type:complete len:96 (-) Transcript_33252:40-327(-)